MIPLPKQTDYSSTITVTFVEVTVNAFLDLNKRENKNTILSEQFQTSYRKIVERGKITNTYMTAHFPSSVQTLQERVAGLI